MPPSPRSAQITEAHRLAQNRLAAQTTRLMDTIWPVLDVNRVDATTERWLRLARPIVTRQHQVSARISADYYERLRVESIPSSSSITPAMPTVAAAEVESSLVVTGPARLNNPPPNQPWTTTVRNARSGVARSAVRMALNGGRGTIVQTVTSDTEAIGYTRTLTSASPCAFCRMLSSRGPVYRSEASAGFDAHDGCHCQPAPAFLDRDLWTDRSIEERTLYETAIAQVTDAGELHRGTSNNLLNAFRRYLANET